MSYNIWSLDNVDQMIILIISESDNQSHSYLDNPAVH